jgi:hypothetical protein
MKLLQKLVILPGLFLFIFLSMNLRVDAFSPSTAEYNFYPLEYDEFVSSVHLNSEDHITVEEKTVVNFITPHHGIFAQIPETYNTDIWYRPVETLDVTVISVTDENGNPVQYSTYSTNGFLEIKIGDPDVTITGIHTYLLTYEIDGAISFFDDFTGFSYNVTGNFSDMPIHKAALFLTADFDFKTDWESYCYTGEFGSDDQDCTINTEANGITVRTTQTLNPQEGLSFTLELPNGLITAPTFLEKYGSYILINLGLFLPFPVFAYVYTSWKKKGKDPKGRDTVVPRFEIPKDFSAAEAGVLIDNSADNIEISATIIDLAIRGYIRIEETKKGFKKDYTFHLNPKDQSKLIQHEKTLLAAFKKKATEEDGKSFVKLSSLKNTFYTTATKIKAGLLSGLVTKEIYTLNPNKLKSTYTGAATALFIGIISIGIPTLGPLGGYGSVFGLLLSAAIIFGFGIYMSQRTEKGSEMLAYIQGMKMYINTAEKDRINMMQDPDSPYAKAPDNTIELFEKLLPYAIVLGVSDAWGKQFKDIYTEQPEWYSGQYRTFSTHHLLNSIGGATTAMASGLTSTPPQSSSSGFRSSGGFGGGGFSGGGVGGGSRGGW